MRICLNVLLFHFFLDGLFASACKLEESTVIPTACVSGVEKEGEDYKDEQETQDSKAKDQWIKLRLVFKEDDFEFVIRVGDIYIYIYMGI